MLTERIGRLPDFFIIGAAKSGTTSLYHYLRQHPSIYMPWVKEPNYFAYKDGKFNLIGPFGKEVILQTVYSKTITDYSAYLQLFQDAKSFQVIGEASVRYLYYSHAPARIAEVIPHAKIIAVLRNPIDRAFSHFRMNRKMQIEPCEDFEKALDLERSRITEGWGWDWHYMRVGRYGEQIARFLNHFNKDQLFVCTYEDFASNTKEVCAQIAGFLGVDSHFAFDVTRKYKVGTHSGGRVWKFSDRLETTRLGRLIQQVLPKHVRHDIHTRIQQGIAKYGHHPESELSSELYERFWQYYVNDLQLLCRVGLDTRAWVKHG